MRRVIGFGDYIVSFTPPGYLRFSQSDYFHVSYTGAEANVCMSLSTMGVETEFVTRIPCNDIARCGLNELKKYNVSIKHVAFGGDRIGLLYLECGASQRPSKVIYDRRHTSFISSSSADYDWDEIFSGRTWFHFTGITPALDDNIAKLCEEACIKAKKHDAIISCDLNYRKTLWSSDKAQHVMKHLLQYVDVLICNEEDAEKALGLSAGKSDIEAGFIDYDAYGNLALRISAEYGCKVVAFTLRESFSATDNNWSGLLYRDGKIWKSRKYNIHIVDRVGGGDSFSAGLIYALNKNFSPQESIEYATAASCLKHTIEYDVNNSTVEEISALMKGCTNGRVLR